MAEQDVDRVWFVTGASRGFGRVWTEAALDRGDAVVASARDTAALDPLVDRYGDRVLPLRLDVTDRAAVFTAVERATDRFGRLDVVVGNAGFGLFGAVEEVGESAARAQIDANVFGVVWLLQAVAPVLRRQRAGRVLLTSSFGGLVSFATAGLYGASKYAIEGLGESFALEMQDFGTKVTLIEPAAYATDFSGRSADLAERIPAYDPARERTAQAFTAMPSGDPQHTAASVLELVDMTEPPLRALLGAHVRDLVLDAYEQRIASWRQHADLADRAQ